MIRHTRFSTSIFILAVALPTFALSFGVSFVSPLSLKVLARVPTERLPRTIGFTPTSKGRTVPIPAGALWYVKPMGTMTDERWEKLSQQIITEKIPGVDLSNRWDVVNAHLGFLDSAPNVQVLLLDHTKISDPALAHVQTLKSLQILSLGPRISDGGLALLAAVPLRSLDISNAKITDIGMQTVGAMKTLERLDLAESTVSNDGLEPLKNLTNLQALVLGADAGNAGMHHLSRLNNLRELDLSATKVSDLGYAQLGGLTHLETLYANASLGDDALKTVGRLTSLRRLDLSNAKITSAGLVYLASLHNLEELALTNTQIDDSGLTAVAQLKRLRVLELSGTLVTPSGVTKLAALSRLNTIALPWPGVYGKDVVLLSALINTNQWYFNGTVMPTDTLAHLRTSRRINDLGDRAAVLVPTPSRATAPERAPVLNAGQTVLIPRTPTGRVQASAPALQNADDVSAPVLPTLSNTPIAAAKTAVPLHSSEGELASTRGIFAGLKALDQRAAADEERDLIEKPTTRIDAFEPTATNQIPEIVVDATH